MTTTNGLSAVHHKIDEQFDSFKARIHDAVDRSNQAHETTSAWLRAVVGRSRDAIKAHPIAAVAVAFGVGYALVRLVRR